MCKKKFYSSLKKKKIDMSKDKHKASEDTALCKVLYTKQPSYRSSQSLEPLHPNLIQNHFMNDDSFYFRKAFSDGSCFFHSVVAASTSTRIWHRTTTRPTVGGVLQRETAAQARGRL